MKSQNYYPVLIVLICIAFFTLAPASAQTKSPVPAFPGAEGPGMYSVGGRLQLKSATPPADTDKDGMPDAWEKKMSLNPKDKTDGSADADGDGYTNLEEYLNTIT